MQPDMATIASAIRNKQIIEFEYAPGWRRLEPHALGLSSDGKPLLRAYQIEGASASGEPEHWKLFRVDRARVIEPTDGTFPEPRPGYRRGDKAMRGGIISEL